MFNGHRSKLATLFVGAYLGEIFVQKSMGPKKRVGQQKEQQSLDGILDNVVLTSVDWFIFANMPFNSPLGCAKTPAHKTSKSVEFLP